jgi:hypothetical protein
MRATHHEYDDNSTIFKFVVPELLCMYTGSIKTILTTEYNEYCNQYNKIA